jgi:hypothetical protein
MLIEQEKCICPRIKLICCKGEIMTSLSSKRGLYYAILCITIRLFFYSPTTLKAETVYFLVGGIYPSIPESYVLPLDDPCDIAYARLLIDEGPFEPNTSAYIVLAAIDRWDSNNSININRDYLQPGIPAWSWYVTKFDGFWEITSELLNGNPSLVENDIEQWIEDTNGYIGFWGYTVVAELGMDLEPWNCDLTVDGIVDFNDLEWFASHWLDSGCSHRFYCDGTDINGSGEADFYDFAIFADNWLWQNVLKSRGPKSLR